MRPQVQWWVVVPLKDTRAAKSRLRDVVEERRQLAIAMACDTLRAVAGAKCVEQVLVVCEREADSGDFVQPGVTVIARPGLSLNEAISAGVEVAHQSESQAAVAALPGDLPYLRPSELEFALEQAARWERACVGDRAGTGTTLLTASAGLSLRPAYGEDSLTRHRDAGAVELGVPDWSGLRRDVDFPEDLSPEGALGPRTRQVLEERGLAAWVGGPA